MTLSNAFCGRNEVPNIEVCSTHDFPLYYKGRARWLKLLKYSLEVPLPNIDLAADYMIHCGFCLFRQISEQYLSWVMNASFHILSTNYSLIIDCGKIDLEILTDLQVFSTTDYESAVCLYIVTYLINALLGNSSVNTIHASKSRARCFPCVRQLAYNPNQQYLAVT